MSKIVFSGINKIYSNNIHAVVDFNLLINEGEFVAFVGPSGCGKSTTLRMLAGLEEITAGEISIDGVVVNHVEPKNRGIAMVFQNYALYPHMSVRENMGFALEMQGMSKIERNKIVEETAKTIGLTNYLDKKPKELSGGQRQRVALGRAIVRKPKVFLMDEPLSNLDAKLRASMRIEITKIHKRCNATTIYVTHDQTEAMTMADRIVVMKDGVIQQIGTPTEVYNDPANLFVATFIGTPAMNLVDAQLTNKKISFLGIEENVDDSLIFNLNEIYKSYSKELEQNISELNELIAKHPIKKKKFMSKKQKQKALKLANNPLTYENQLKNNKEKLLEVKKALQDDVKSIKIGIRPEDICFVDEGKKSLTKPISFNVEETELLGHDILIHLSQNENKFIVVKEAKQLSKINSFFCFDKKEMFFFDPVSSKRIYQKHIRKVKDAN